MTLLAAAVVALGASAMRGDGDRRRVDRPSRGSLAAPTTGRNDAGVILPLAHIPGAPAAHGSVTIQRIGDGIVRVSLHTVVPARAWAVRLVRRADGDAAPLYEGRGGDVRFVRTLPLATLIGRYRAIDVVAAPIPPHRGPNAVVLRLRTDRITERLGPAS